MFELNFGIQIKTFCKIFRTFCGYYCDCTEFEFTLNISFVFDLNLKKYLYSYIIL